MRSPFRDCSTHNSQPKWRRKSGSIHRCGIKTPLSYIWFTHTYIFHHIENTLSSSAFRTHAIHQHNSEREAKYIHLNTVSFFSAWNIFSNSAPQFHISMFLTHIYSNGYICCTTVCACVCVCVCAYGFRLSFEWLCIHRLCEWLWIRSLDFTVSLWPV